MNGRLYDPLLARMLSPDNYVQDETDPQNYNRYSYVKNNPLKFIDPSGEYYEPPTYYTDELGNLLFFSNDNLDNRIVVIDNENLETFRFMLSDAFENQENMNADGKNLYWRTLGQNYDVDSFVDFFKRNSHNTKALNDDKGNPMYIYDPIKGNTDIRAYQMIEYSNRNYVNTNNVVFAGTTPDNTSGFTDEVNGFPERLFPQGVVASNIHSHGFDNLQAYSRTPSYGGYSSSIPILFGGKPSLTDKRNNPRGEFYHVVMTSRTMYLYNRKNSHDLKIPLSYFGY